LPLSYPTKEATAMAVDWKEPALVNWLGTTGREKTVAYYKSAFSAYAESTGLTSE